MHYALCYYVPIINFTRNRLNMVYYYIKALHSIYRIPNDLFGHMSFVSLEN